MAKDVKSTVTQVAMTLAAVVTAMVTFWLVEGREYVTRAETSDIVSKESPYIADRALILESMARSESTNEKLATAIDNLNMTMVRIETRLEVQ